MRPDFVTGSIDLHIHSGPDVIPRIGTCIDIARHAADAGMRAVVFKDHVFPSFVKALLTQQAVPEIEVFGGICLNASVGGLNVTNVKGAIKGGARIVMFPTFDSALYYYRPTKNHLHIQHLQGEQPALVRTVGEDGKLVPEAERILQVLVEHPDVILSSGHLGDDELLPLFRRAHELGIRRMVMEHPNDGHLSKGVMEECRDMGVLFAISYNPHSPMMARKDPRETIELIRTLGVKSCGLMTDGGQPYNAWPSETMRVMCEMLHQLGLTLDEIDMMARANPAVLLGLDPVSQSRQQ